MKGIKTELAVGIFAIATFAILSFMTFRVGEFLWFKKPGYIIYVDFKNSAGIEKRTKVRIAGVEAGTIEEITLADGRARLTLRIHQSVNLYSDASAAVKSTGLLGDKYLELQIGSRQPLLKGGDTIMKVEEVTEIDDLIKKVTELASDLDETFKDKEMRDSLKESVRNLRDITANLKETINTSDVKFQRILDRIDSLTASLDDIIKINRAPLTNAIADIGSFADSLKSEGKTLVANLNGASADLRDLVKQSRPDIESITNTVNSIAKKVERGEGTLGKLVADEKLYASLTNTIDGLGGAVAGLQRFRTFITLGGYYLPEISDGPTFIYLTLQPRENKYYILGLVDEPIGSVTTKTITTDGVSVTEKKVESTLRFTAQFGKRIKNTAIRGGITENYFGVGADQFLFKDRVKVSADIWDFRRLEFGAESPHLRVVADYFLFKKVFLSGGMDNILNEEAQYPFLGGGVAFEDEDFKYLFGWLPTP